MPELECVGGPKDGELLSFYGDAFPTTERPDGGLVLGRYLIERYVSPQNGMPRMVWRWHDATLQQEDGA